MEKKSRKSIIIGITGLLLVTLTLLGLTYAYYRTRIIGNEADTSVSVSSQLLEVVYSDNNATFTANGIAPGYSNESNPKTFTVENTGTEKISYSIKLDNIDNEFNRLDWTYELLQGETIIETGVIPNGASEVYIANSIEIDTETTQNFKLIIRYANSSEDQSEDMEKALTFRINIDDETGTTFKKYASEGTLLAAIEKDNDLAVPLSTPGEEASLTKYKEVAGTPSSKNLTASYQEYYIAYADSYKFNEWGGTFDLVNPQVGKYSEVYSSLEGKYILYIGTTSSSTSSSLKKTGGTSVYKITSATANTTNTFAYDEITREATSASESVLASAEDDYGNSYYYRGGVENNYVNYSGMCWRIVRVQGNGTIKLILADENGKCNAETYSKDNTTSAFVDGRTDIFYKSNAYGKFEDIVFANSDIPSILNTWKDNRNLDTTQLVEAEWCNDTSYTSYGIDEGTSEIAIDYNGKARSNPSFKCDFTGINDSKATIYKNVLGILSADEVKYAGLKTNSKTYTYLFNNASGGTFLTMTPIWTLEGHSGQIFAIDNGNTLMEYEFQEDVWNSEGYNSVRPSIVLKATALLDSSITGQNGTQTNPYEI